MEAIKLTCRVNQKKNHFSLELPSNEVRARVQELLRDCRDQRGGFVSFQLAPPRRPRSTGKGSQSNHFNGHVQQIAIELGQPFDDVKKYIKYLAISRGYPILKNEDGPIYDMWGNIRGISEADCSTEECSILIEAAHQFAAEAMINLAEE